MCELDAESRINRHREFIAEHLDPSQVLQHLASYIQDQEYNEILDESRCRSREAAFKLLDALQHSPYRGWYPAFISALSNEGYFLLLGILQGEIHIDGHKIFKRLLNVFRCIVNADVEPHTLIPHLIQCQCINHNDADDIIALEIRRYACEKMLFLVTRKHEKWFPCLMHALKECGYEHVVKAIEPEFASADSLAAAYSIAEKMTETQLEAACIQNVYTDSPTEQFPCQPSQFTADQDENEDDENYDEIDGLGPVPEIPPDVRLSGCSDENVEGCECKNSDPYQNYKTSPDHCDKCGKQTTYYNTFTAQPSPRRCSEPPPPIPPRRSDFYRPVAPPCSQSPPPILPRKSRLQTSTSTPTFSPTTRREDPTAVTQASPTQDSGHRLVPQPTYSRSHSEGGSTSINQQTLAKQNESSHLVTQSLPRNFSQEQPQYDYHHQPVYSSCSRIPELANWCMECTKKCYEGYKPCSCPNHDQLVPRSHDTRSSAMNVNRHRKEGYSQSHEELERDGFPEETLEKNFRIDQQTKAISEHYKL